ncbi:MAG: aminotransferase class I/II-fold pyridoxal phosphate-dependent enzyme [Holosporales bacterium]|jgi:threonine aldolase|nr:aminotransferase class I/II-fold pyridoxal phosphate-dependent enzyme [Holosporales bacterium]
MKSSQRIEFSSDYNEGAHPRLIQKLVETNMAQTFGYGLDPYCDEAVEIIRDLCGNRDVDVHFVVGGTLTNLISVAACLRAHEGVISPTNGHIHILETGSIEATGHKILLIQGENGKITASQIDREYEEYCNSDARVHLVHPKLVYITHPTEYGTLYTKAELKAISDVCKKRGLYLFVDGARLGYGMTAKGSDFDIKFLTECCDIFYIGGAKQGALFGEAIVVKNKNIADGFRQLIKQRGGLMSKGRLLGMQFSELFRDGLYFDIAKHANEMADLIRTCLKNAGIRFFVENTTNLLFPIFPDDMFHKLSEKYSLTNFSRWNESSSVIRIATSWATTEQNVNALIHDIEEAAKQFGAQLAKVA